MRGFNSSCTTIYNIGCGNAEGFADRYEGFPLFDELSFLVILQNFLPGFTVPATIVHIVNIGTPLEVLNSVIGFVLIYVVDLGKIIRIWDEYLGDNDMDVEVDVLMVFVKLFEQISKLVFLRFYDSPWQNTSSFSFTKPDIFRQTTNPTKVAHFIKTGIVIGNTIFCYDDRFPNLFNHTANLYANIQK